MNSTKTFAAVAATVLAASIGIAYMAHPKVKSVQELQQSTVSLTMADGAACSGWVLAGSHKVVTAAHCVADEGNAEVAVDFHDGTGVHKFVPEKVGDITGAKPDLATLVTKDNTVKWPEGLSPCPFKPYYLEPVYLFGDPLGFQSAITIGSISNPYQVVKSAREAGYIQYDGSLSPGNSGGAVVDIEHQCVIASADALISPYTGDSVKFLEPISRLGEI